MSTFDEITKEARAPTPPRPGYAVLMGLVSERASVLSALRRCGEPRSHEIRETSVPVGVLSPVRMRVDCRDLVKDVPCGLLAVLISLG